MLGHQWASMAWISWHHVIIHASILSMPHQVITTRCVCRNKTNEPLEWQQTPGNANLICDISGNVGALEH
jgi:hypothetical protein